MKNYFETADHNLAATIISTIGAPVVAIDRSDPYHVRILFHREDVVDEFIDAYFRGDLRIEPLTFSLAQRYLKNRIDDGIIDESLPTGLSV